MKENVEIKKRVTKEIISTVAVPAVSFLCFVLWLYFFIKTRSERPYIFPLSGMIIMGLYFFSGEMYSGILLGTVTIVGILGVALIPEAWLKLAFFSEVVWLWGLFLLLQNYQKTYVREVNRIKEDEDVINTKISLLESRSEETKRHCDNLRQQIANYQLLGGMVQILGSTLQEEKIVPLVTELAKKFIGKGSWLCRKGAHSGDMISKYLKDTRLPVIITNARDDNRFFLKKSRFSSLIAVPLEIGDKYWGMLRGEATECSFFDESDLRLLSLLGGITSLALNNSKLYEQTQALAITDGLTGLFVQSYFKERLKEEVLRSKSHNLALSVAIFDVDFFKKFNDSYGHAAGDAVLRQLANILQNSFRETDLICRYGGEEFAVIMLQTDIHEAFRILDNIRKDIAAERFYLPVESFQPVQSQVTVSIGAAGMNEKITNEDELLDSSDKMLYKAKSGGRNRTEVV